MQFSTTKKQLLEKKFEKALEEYQDAAKNSPDDIRIHIKIAELYLENKYKDKAIDEYRYAANAYTNKKLFQIAIAIYNHILSIDHNLTDVYTTLTQLYLQNGFRGDAVATLEKLAGYYYDKSMKSEAIQVLQHITEIDPANEFFKLKVAQFFETKDHGDNKPAQPIIQKPVESTPAQVETTPAPADNESPAFYDLEAALQHDRSFDLSAEEPITEHQDRVAEDITQENYYDEIFREIKQSFENTPEQKIPDFHFNLGIAHQRLGEFEAAIEEFENALLNDEKTVDSIIQLAQCFRALDRPDRAEEYIKQGLSMNTLSKDDRRRLTREQDGSNGTGKMAGIIGFFKKILQTNKNQ